MCDSAHARLPSKIQRRSSGEDFEGNVWRSALSAAKFRGPEATGDVRRRHVGTKATSAAGGQAAMQLRNLAARSRPPSQRCACTRRSVESIAGVHQDARGLLVFQMLMSRRRSPLSAPRIDGMSGPASADGATTRSCGANAGDSGAPAPPSVQSVRPIRAVASASKLSVPAVPPFGTRSRHCVRHRLGVTAFGADTDVQIGARLP